MTDIAEQSIKFVEKQIELNYKTIMERNIVKDMYWIETDIGARCVAKMFNPKEETENLFVLFPPFLIEEENK